MKGICIIISCLLFITFLTGCGTSYKKPTIEEQPMSANEEITVEAYLFDTKLRQDGKPTSVRLFFFQTDSIIAIGGKGYLGKGALKGWLDEDSIKINFPATNEYLYESVDDLFASFDCTGKLPRFDLMALFSDLPDNVLDDVGASVIKVNDKSKRPKYQIEFANCLWQLDITYDIQDNGFRIRDFMFSDGKSTTLTAKRREYKKDRKVKASRFEVLLSPESLRIIP